jgi:polar amino acid transport system ATP-binding protein
MPAPDRILALHNVHKDYHGLRPLRVQLLELRDGESIALLGFDEAAAEVFVNLATGATLPDAGDVTVFGTLTRSIVDADAWLASMDRFGILSARVVLLDAFTVEQNLTLPFSLEFDNVPPGVRQTVRALAEELGIASLLGASAATLDAEDALRVRLAKALALEPRLLLAEHPQASLSREECARFARDLTRIAARRGLAVLALTADEEFARAVSDNVLMVRAATGELRPAGGWRSWLGR